MDTLLEVTGLSGGYGGSRVVRDLSFKVAAGEVVALLGANGAGKTTTLLTLAGALPALGGKISWLGSEKRTSLYRRSKQGLSLVEERSVFMRLTTQRNLQLGRGCDVPRALELFPELEPLLGRRAGLLSGGEQQILTLARALARSPRLLLADELSHGLAPQTTAKLFRAVRAAADDGLGTLLVEQHVPGVMGIADRLIVLRQGEIVYEGSASDASGRMDEIQSYYLSRGGEV